jgi:predicted amidohydrolase
MSTGDCYLAAAVQFEPILGQKARNIGVLVELTHEAIHRGAKLIVLPEMATSGYCWRDRAEIAPVVETIPGPTTEIFSKLARENDCWIVIGLPEIDASTGAYFNSSVLIGPDGIEGLYRKTHSFITEVRWAQDGNLGLPVFETKIGTLGMLICMDAEYPEPARVLATQDCDVVCFPTNWLADQSPSSFWITRAYENGTYWVAANRHGHERGVQFSGGSGVIGPDGSIIDRVHRNDGVALSRIDLDLARSTRRSRLNNRQVELSRTVLQNSYLWPDVFRWPVDDTAALHGLNTRGANSSPQLAVLPNPDWVELTSSSLTGWVREILPAEDFGLIAVPPRSLGQAPELAQVERIERSTTDILSSIASATGASVVGGVMTGSGDGTRERICLVDPEGRVVLRYDASVTSARSFAAGPRAEEPPIVNVGWGRIGVLSATDLLQPEPTRYLAVQGVDVVACVGQLSRPPSLDVEISEGDGASAIAIDWLLPRVRAAENNVWLVFANAGSLTSGVFGPLFYKLPRAEALVTDNRAATFSPAVSDPIWGHAVQQKPYLRMRLPHLYEALIHQSPKKE